MSYYTGLNELNLIPLRLFTATHSNALSDNDLQQLVQRDPHTLARTKAHSCAAYKDAEPEAKQFLEGVVAETDPGFLQTMRANT